MANFRKLFIGSVFILALCCAPLGAQEPDEIHAYQQAVKDRSILYLILGFVGLGIVDYIMLQSDLNKVADIYAGVAPAGQAPYQAPYQAPQYQAPQQPQYQPPQYQPPQQPYQGDNQNQ